VVHVYHARRAVCCDSIRTAEFVLIKLFFIFFACFCLVALRFFFSLVAIVACVRLLTHSTPHSFFYFFFSSQLHNLYE
jgi:hypothetical protein